MNPGELRDRVTFQELVNGVWTNIATAPSVWAEVEYQGPETYRIRIRFRSDLRDMKDASPITRVLWRDLILHITEIIEAVPRRELHLVAEHQLVESDHLKTGVKRKQPGHV